jgi:hypothetical protein
MSTASVRIVLMHFQSVSLYADCLCAIVKRVRCRRTREERGLRMGILYAATDRGRAIGGEGREGPESDRRCGSGRFGGRRLRDDLIGGMTAEERDSWTVE